MDQHLRMTRRNGAGKEQSCESHQGSNWEPSCRSQGSNWEDKDEGMPTFKIFSCYCGDHFITPGAYAKHATLHASGEFKPDADDEGDVVEVYLESGVERQVKKDINYKKQELKEEQTHSPSKVKAMSVSSQGTFFTAQTQ